MTDPNNETFTVMRKSGDVYVSSNMKLEDILSPGFHWASVVSIRRLPAVALGKDVTNSIRVNAKDCKVTLYGGDK